MVLLVFVLYAENQNLKMRRPELPPAVCGSESIISPAKVSGVLQIAAAAF